MTTTTALCATLLPTVGDLWFSDDPADRAKAKRYCARCPLLIPCQEAGLADPAASGVWGGLSAHERAGRRARLLDCGTEAGFIRHRQRGEECVHCEEAHEGRVLAGRLASLAGEHGKGGTAWGYHLHRLLGEDPCGRCRVAMRADRAASKARRRAQRLSGARVGNGSTGGLGGAQAATGAAA